MKVEKLDGSRERRILTGMIVDESVLAEVAAKWDGEMFDSPWTNLVGEWCVDYYNRYAKPPRKAIEGLYESWALSQPDKSTEKLVGKFLSDLSGEYVRLSKDLNPKEVLDTASEHFNRVRWSRLAEQIQGAIDSGHLKLAEKAYNQFHKLEVGVGAGIDLLQDRNLVKRVFQQQSEPLVTYPGSLGQLFGGSLARDSFVAFMGREKIGKSWWLLDLAWRAMLQRKRVAFFEVGDLTEEQVAERFLTRAAMAPLFSDEGWPCTIKVPKAISRVDEAPTVEFEERSYKSPVSEEVAWKALQRVKNDKVKSDESYFRLSCHSARILTIQGAKSIIQTWVRQGWKSPDVVVFDYADILAFPPGFQGESRDAVNENWIQLRALSTDLHCLVVTATQANATAYKANRLDMSSYSEDKRKFSHVTGMIGLSQTDDEKEQEVMVLNWLARRSRKHYVKRYCYVAGCLGIASPALKSTF